MVSCYADLSAARTKTEPWPGPFHAQVIAARARLADAPESLELLETDLRNVSVKLAEAPPQARGVAIFSAAERGLTLSVALGTAVSDAMVIEPMPYLTPLLQALCRRRDYLVVLTDSHRGRLYEAVAGGLRMMEEVQEELPRRRRSTGAGWGSQSAINRQREEHIFHYRKRLLGLIEKAWAAHAYRGLVFMGNHEATEHLRKELPPRLAEHVVHECTHPWTERLSAEALRAVLAGVEQDEVLRVLEELGERLLQGYAVAAGPHGVLEALQKGRIGPRGHGHLVLGPDTHASVARCTTCRMLSADMPDDCPRCGDPCVVASLWEEVILLALRHDITVYCVGPNEFLERYGGLAAVLPRDVARASIAH